MRNNRKRVEAMRVAGYNGTDGSLNVMACRLLKRVHVKSALDELFQDRIMSALDVLSRHSEIAEGSMDDVVDPVTGRFDITRARETGAIHNVKAITSRTYFDKGKGAEVTELRAELYSKDAAQKTIMQYHGLLVNAIAVKKLPKDRDKLVELLRQQIKRVANVDVPPTKTAAPAPGKAN